ncbi:hypothetical protein Acor_83040 [Acrocarpospora corrugata]|uniref:Uncharacterized protein n=1 Tax=Acrocarpospora corrugata TaxID=35763 RepID=A0A5M3WB19_9ACTN|nr:hypothetical protein [Acrocarpospora corrugata]GES06235.1 hypothetical protein Acor_83040 [Acrocarpospora corrugata]
MRVLARPLRAGRRRRRLRRGQVLVEATEAQTPFRTHYTGLEIGAPRPASGATALVTSPTSTVPTTDGDIAFVVDGWNFPSNVKVGLESTGLNAACTGGTSLRRTQATADRNGRFTVAVVRKGCVTVAYQLEATEMQTPFKTYTTTLTLSESK